MVVELKKNEDTPLPGQVQLDGSKSISNRVLAIRSLCSNPFPIQHLSGAADTRIFQTLLENETDIFDAGDGGTTFRFFTALLAIREGSQILTGSERMKQRPIAPLVNALNQLGAQITYLEKNGFPPLKIGAPDFLNQKSRSVEIEAGLSSQFVSALLMIAPLLPDGLELHFVGKTVSAPYIRMTLRLMDYFGVKSRWEGAKISIPKQTYQGAPITIEADWSAASYFYGLAALSESAEIQLGGLMENSLQGDAVLVEIMRRFGVQTTFNSSGISLKKVNTELPKKLELDCTDCPDLVQTFSVICAGLGVEARLSGVQTLKIKETDRLAALQKELKKTGVTLEYYTVDGQEILVQSGKANFSKEVIFETYGDHRMAMAFAQFAAIQPVRIQNPEVVKKSYPAFWADLQKLGIELREQE